jgi:hypothetical protein
MQKRVLLYPLMLLDAPRRLFISHTINPVTTTPDKTVATGKTSESLPAASGGSGTSATENATASEEPTFPAASQA